MFFFNLKLCKNSWLTRQIPAKSLGYLWIYVPFQLPKKGIFCFLRLKPFGGREGYQGYQTWFLSWDILLEPLHPGLIPPGTHHHGHYHRRCSPRRRQRPRRRGCAWRCWEPPGWRRRRGRNRWRAWRTDASAYPGRQKMLNVVGCWGWAWREKKLWSYKLRGIDWLFFFSLKWGGIFWQQNLFGVRGWVKLSVWSGWYFDVVFFPLQKGPTMNVSMMRRAISKVNYWLSEYAPETLRWEMLVLKRSVISFLSDKTKLVTLFLLFFSLISLKPPSMKKHVSSVLGGLLVVTHPQAIWSGGYYGIRINVMSFQGVCRFQSRRPSSWAWSK